MASSTPLFALSPLETQILTLLLDARAAAHGGASSAGLSQWQLIPKMTHTLQEFSASMQALEGGGLISQENNAWLLTSQGVAALTARSPSCANSAHLRLRCRPCGGHGRAVLSDNPTFSLFKKALEGRPDPIPEFDQGDFTPEEALMRVAIIHDHGDLLGASILLVGDDDLVSLALAATGLPKRVVVLEVDERIVSFVNARREMFPSVALEAVTYDVAQPLPPHLVAQFDVFVCDPVETLKGISLFLSRGVKALRPSVGASVVFGLTTIEAGRRKWRDIQRLLLDLGFVLTDVLREFQHYNETGAEDTTRICVTSGESSTGGGDWYTSSLLRAERCVLDSIALPYPGAYEGDTRDIYLDDEAWATPVLDAK